MASYAGTAETTIYIGGLLEKVTRSGVTSYKHLIAGGSGPVAVYTRKSDGTNQTHYLTRDHLGSVDSVTNSSGAIEVRLAFGSFGQRRKEAGWSGAVPSADLNQITATTRHGFTFHELLDNLALTHMNGRVYDQVVGRFLSADPFVPAPLSTQSYNRYSYTHNNPLSFTDPSGFAEGDELPCCGNGWNNVPTTGHPEDNPRNPGAEERVAKYDAEPPLPAPTPAGDGRIGQVPNFEPTQRQSTLEVFIAGSSAYWADESASSGLQGFLASISNFTLKSPREIALTYGENSWTLAFWNVFVTGWVDASNSALHGDYAAVAVGIGMAVVKPARVAKGIIEWHHLLPKARNLKPFFERTGLNIEDYKIPLDQGVHRLNPGGIHTTTGGDWNKVWKNFFETNPNATRDQILEQLERMRRDFGI